jgi:hypothetical protein
MDLPFPALLSSERESLLDGFGRFLFLLVPPSSFAAACLVCSN